LVIKFRLKAGARACIEFVVTMPSTRSSIIPNIKSKPAAIQFLEKQLTSGDEQVRMYGIETIPELKTPLEPLIDCLAFCLDHENWITKRAGALACCRAIRFPSGAERAIEVAGKRLRVADVETRRQAGQALVMIVQDAHTGPPECAEMAAGYAAEALEDADPHVRKAAVEVLSQMGDQARPHIELLAKHISDEDLSVRNAINRSFTDLGVLTEPCTVEAGRLLTHADPVMKRAGYKAIMTLAAHSGASATAAVAAHLTCEDVISRKTVLFCMQDLGPLCAPHGKALADRLEDADNGIRYTAVRTMVKTGGSLKTSMKYVFRRVSHAQPEVRRVAVDAMRQMSSISKTFAHAAGKALQEEPDEPNAKEFDHRVNILKILGGAGTNAKPFLHDIANELGSEDWAVRRAAIETLADLGEHSVDGAGEVARRLLHHDPTIRKTAAIAMGRMGKSAGQYVDRLETLLDEEQDQDVVEACEEAMDRLEAAGALH